MKVIIVPDIHQETENLNFLKTNKKFIDNEGYEVVFLGDLLDAWEADAYAESDTKNPKAIIELTAEIFKGKNWHWLVGNHDIAYIDDRQSSYVKGVSGHQHSRDRNIGWILRQYLDQMDVAIQLGDWVFSHGGFSGRTIKMARVPRKGMIVDFLNKEFHKEHYDLFHYYHPETHWSNFSMMWNRPNGILIDPCFCKQIVGHTECGPVNIKTVKASGKVKSELVILDSRTHDGLYMLDTSTDIICPMSKSFKLGSPLDIRSELRSWEDIKKDRKELRKEGYLC